MRRLWASVWLRLAAISRCRTASTSHPCCRGRSRGEDSPSSPEGGIHALIDGGFFPQPHRPTSPWRGEGIIVSLLQNSFSLPPLPPHGMTGGERTDIRPGLRHTLWNANSDLLPSSVVIVSTARSSSIRTSLVLVHPLFPLL